MGVSGGVFMEAPVPKGAPKKGQKPVRSNISEPLRTVQRTAYSGLRLIGVWTVVGTVPRRLRCARTRRRR